MWFIVSVSGMCFSPEVIWLILIYCRVSYLWNIIKIGKQPGKRTYACRIAGIESCLSSTFRDRASDHFNGMFSMRYVKNVSRKIPGYFFCFTRSWFDSEILQSILSFQSYKDWQTRQEAYIAWRYRKLSKLNILIQRTSDVISTVFSTRYIIYSSAILQGIIPTSGVCFHQKLKYCRVSYLWNLT